MKLDSQFLYTANSPHSKPVVDTQPKVGRIRPFNLDLVMSSRPSELSRSRGKAGYWIVWFFLFFYFFFLLCFTVWCDAGRNSRTSAVFQIKAACIDIKTNYKVNVVHSTKSAWKLWFSPIQFRNASYYRLVHFILCLVYIKITHCLLLSVIKLYTNASPSLHITVLCSSDSGNGYQNQMEDTSQESVWR